MIFLFCMMVMFGMAVESCCTEYGCDDDQLARVMLKTLWNGGAFQNAEEPAQKIIKTFLQAPCRFLVPEDNFAQNVLVAVQEMLLPSVGDDEATLLRTSLGALSKNLEISSWMILESDGKAFHRDFGVTRCLDTALAEKFEAVLYYANKDNVFAEGDIKERWMCHPGSVREVERLNIFHAQRRTALTALLDAGVESFCRRVNSQDEDVLLIKNALRSYDRQKAIEGNLEEDVLFRYAVLKFVDYSITASLQEDRRNNGGQERCLTPQELWVFKLMRALVPAIGGKRSDVAHARKGIRELFEGLKSVIQHPVQRTLKEDQNVD